MTEVKGPDNEPCLALVAGKTGILAQLDEECAIGDRGSDKGFLENVCARHSGNPFFEKKPLAKTSFIVKHYAGNVSYEVAGWLDKNRDTLKDAIRLIMRDSQDPLIKTLIDEPMERTKGRALTVGGFFKNQVQELMHVINSTNPHWIRCVKPHPAKKPLMFSGTTTINQLIASGVLSTVKIRKAGYPIRTTFDKFCKRYAIITPRPEGGDVKKWAQAILNKCGLNENKHAQMGTTKVFMKSESLPLIERERALSSVLYVMRMQSAGRGYLGRLAGYRILYERNREAIEAARELVRLRQQEERERLEAERIQREQIAKEAMEAEERRRVEAERQEREERLRRERERWLQDRMQALQEEMDSFVRSISFEEPEEWVLITNLFHIHQDRILLRVRITQLIDLEMHDRMTILSDWRGPFGEFWEKIDLLQERVEHENASQEYWKVLERNREARAKAEFERLERAHNKRRSCVERVVLPVKEESLRKHIAQYYNQTRENSLRDAVARKRAEISLRESKNANTTLSRPTPHRTEPTVRNALQIGQFVRIHTNHILGRITQIAPDTTSHLVRIHLETGIHEWFQRNEFTLEPLENVTSPTKYHVPHATRESTYMSGPYQAVESAFPSSLTLSSGQAVGNKEDWNRWQKEKIKHELTSLDLFDC